MWLSAAGLLGVLLAVPLRRHFIEDEKLPFPAGMAAGETLIMLDSRGAEARTAAVAMFGALGMSGLTFLATQLRWVVDNVPLASTPSRRASDSGSACRCSTSAPV